jgi:branched-chain amino acid transport system substrate-binding protein
MINKGEPVFTVATRAKTTRRLLWALLPALLVATACGNRAGRNVDTAAQVQAAYDAGYQAASSGEAPVDEAYASGDSETPAAGIPAAGDPSAAGSTAAGSSAGAAGGGTSGAQPGRTSNAAGAGSAGGQTAGKSQGKATGSAAAGSAAASPGAKSSASGAPTPGAPSPGAVTGGKRPTITIGNIGHWSGVLGNMGIPTLHAVKAWVGDVNARGGLNGHPVRLVSADDNSEPGRALSEARRMVEQEKAIAILGTWMPLTLHAVTPYLEEKQVAAISTCNCEPADDESPMVFPVGPGGLGNSYLHSLPMLTSVDQSVRDNVGVLYCREAPICPFTQKNLRTLQKEMNFKIVWEGQASIAAPDYTSEMLSAQGAGVKALIDVIDNYSVLRIERSAQRQGYEVIHSVQHSMFDSRFEGMPELEGVYTSSAVPMWNLSPKMADYREALKKYVPGGVPAAWGATPWVGGKLLEKVAQTFSPNPGPADVLTGLFGLNNETLGGLLPGVTYYKGEKHKMSNMCMIPVRMKDKKFVPRDGDPDKFICAPGWKPGLHN